MRKFSGLSSLSAAVGTEVGTSKWIAIDQQRIDDFARVTGDNQWIHTDPERTMSELGMPTIAHGFFTLSLVPVFLQDILQVETAKRIINYGSNKVRFTSMVPVNSRIRGRLFLKKAVPGPNSLRTISEITVETDQGDKPALYAELITLWYE